MLFRYKLLLPWCLTLILGACHSTKTDPLMGTAANPLPVESYWLTESAGGVMLDPQTSGLTLWRNGRLVIIADGSAHESQVLRLIVLDAQQFQVEKKYPMVVAPEILQGCFAEYMSKRPDLEALVVDPDDDRVFYTVTEDASRYSLSPACAEKYRQTGSTEYPTLLVRLALDDVAEQVTVTHVRPLQYSAAMQVGNHPNDGIEGMSFGSGRTLYLGLEKDALFQPRIFSVELNSKFWNSVEFARVTDEQLLLPVFSDQIPHPINALTYVQQGDNGWLVAAARNDNELWLVDPEKKNSTRRIKLSFLAKTSDTKQQCAEFTAMNNYSIEGLAGGNGVLWLVNDPWKENYQKNIQCQADKNRYDAMAPLLSQIPIETLFTNP